MEYKDVFISIGIVFIGLIGIVGWIASWNTDYNTNAGSSLNSTIAHMQSYQSDYSSLGRDTAGDTQVADGSGQISTSVLITKSLSTLRRVPQLLGLVPALLNDAASIIGIPAIILDIIVTIFLFIFALTFAYILLLGAKKLL